MSTAARVAAFVGALAVVFAAALGLGRLTGSPAPAAQPEHQPEHQPEQAGAGHTAGHTAGQAGGHAGPVGLERSADGFSIELAEPVATAGRRGLAFVVRGPDGEPVVDYEVQHEKELHLVVVRRDLTGFQHVHPELDEATGTWTTRVDLTPGTWRVLADLDPAAGDPVVLGTDLHVAGTTTPRPLGDDRLDGAVGGYDVTLAGGLAAGHETTLTATVSRDGVPVTDLEPYLGALGHLVALRDGDVGYLHVHPEESDHHGPAVTFATTFPSAGRYRLFLEFQHEGTVRMVPFTVTVTDGGDEHGHDESGAH
ncbi:hypothetical protein [Nocardioides sp. SYSU D00038]|uniref:hypothetical protein n=1 Tax=Nocardioides sp. SYSU D00038 TaxID=2812554 RepID=UPI001967DBD6|nr:hypothetical protein [Nocardioides sp. SYSU D00038]